MSSRCRDALFVAVCALALPAAARELVVCADPDALPYSRADASGFENRIAEVVADDLHATLRFVWQPLRRGVVRKTLQAHACDVLAGVPVGLEGLATTAPYYRSGYAFVHDRAAGAPIESFDDPRLRIARIGVQLVGADMAETPAAHALARRGIVDNVVGFSVYGGEPAAQRMVEALADGTIDVALIWGPQAGYFARHARRPLAVTLARDDDLSQQTFAIAFGVRKDDTALRDEIDRALEDSRDRIAAILADFGVPRASP